ncbi:hypothetical protein SESBI_20633 [Sesbania bispinosa]|nr:hypothetical protein SESBI_20633 [Sesbania bispinosa]
MANEHNSPTISQILCAEISNWNTQSDRNKYPSNHWLQTGWPELYSVGKIKSRIFLQGKGRKTTLPAT